MKRFLDKNSARVPKKPAKIKSISIKTITQPGDFFCVERKKILHATIVIMMMMMMMSSSNKCQHALRMTMT